MKNTENVVEKLVEDLEVMDDVTVTDLPAEDISSTASGVGVKIGVVAVVAAVGAVLYHKNKDKIKDWKNQKRIAKLEKDGYQVITPSADDETVDYEDEDVQ